MSETLIYSKIASKITPDMDNMLIEIICKCYIPCSCDKITYKNCICRNTMYEIIKKYVKNNQKQADAMHIIASLENKDSPVLARLESVVKLLRESK